MKKSICFIILIVFLLSGITAQGSASYNLKVSFTNNPTVVSPGSSSYIELILENSGSATLANVDVDVVSRDSLTIIKQGDWDLEVGNLGSGDQISLLYEFSIPTSATSGLYQIVFEISSPAGDHRQAAMIRVEDSNVLDIISATPSLIDIGRETTIVFNVTNTGGINITNLIFSWDDPNDVIIPIGSDSRQIVTLIPYYGYTEIPINVMATPLATPGVYPLEITMEYNDHTGTKQTITSEVGFQVGGTTDFEILVTQSSTSSATFSIVNTGANTASSVIVSIPEQASYVAVGDSSVSLGNLDAGDDTLATFQITSTQSAQNMSNMPPMSDGTPLGNFSNPRDFRRDFGNFSSGPDNGKLKIDISYTDLFGVRQTVQKEISISSTASTIIGDTGTGFTGGRGMRFNQEETEESDNATNYIIIGVVGIIAIVVVLQIAKRKDSLKFLKTGKLTKKSDKIIRTKKNDSNTVESESSVWKPVPLENKELSKKTK